MRRPLCFALIVWLLGTAGSCSNSNESLTGPVRQTGIELAPTDLWPLVQGQGFYELWLGVPERSPAEGENPWELEQLWTAAAPFRVDGEGKLRDLQNAVVERFRLPRELDADAIARGVITYQPSSDAGGPHPMGQWLAVGDFVAPGGTISSTLDWDSAEVIDKDLREISGSFRLRTETAAEGPALPNGQWFYLPAEPETGGSDEPSLELGAALPEGYVYEAWTFQRGLSSLLPLQLYSLGRFQNASGPDSDRAGPYARPGVPSAPFPGQDFVVDTVREFNDGSWSTMVTIELQLDPMPQVPSALRVLERTIRMSDGIDLPLVLTNRASEDRLPEVLVTVIR